MIHENTSLADFTKLSGDDFSDIEAKMASTSSGVTSLMSFRVAPICCWSDINGSGAMLSSAAAI